MISPKPILLVVLLTISFVNSYYVHYEDEIPENEHKQILTDDIIQIKSLDEKTKFPQEFVLTFNYKGKDEEHTFIKDGQWDEQEKNTWIMTDQGLSQHKKPSKPHYHYRRVDGSGAATLFKHEHNPQEFQLCATLSLDGVLSHSIYPIRLSEKLRKRRGLTTNNHEIITLSQAINQDSIPVKPIMVNPSVHNENQSAKRKVYARGANGPLTITGQIVAVLDYTIYLKHQMITNSQNSTIVIQSMRIYYAHLFYSVNLRFTNSFSNDPNLNLSIQLTNILILTTNASSQWSNAPFNATTTSTFLASGCLSNFQQLMSNQTWPFQYHIALGFLDKSLVGDTGAGIIGLGYTPAVCSNNNGPANDYRYGIVVDHGGFYGADIAAHELGHNFGSLHDGDLNSCNASFGLVMAPVNTMGTSSYSYSACTKTQIKNTILSPDFSTLLSNQQCLINMTIINNVPEDAYPLILPAGKIWTVTDLCKQFYGANATFCQPTNYSSICSSVYCKAQPTDTNCYANFNAPEKTPCGPGMSCTTGACIADASVPIPSNNTCVEGSVGPWCFYSNNPVVTNTTTCKVAVALMVSRGIDPASYCNNQVLAFASTCCNMCAFYKSNAANCYDLDISCSLYKPNCNKGTNYWSLTTNSFVNVNKLCPYTCGNCTRKPVTCPNQWCQNGGTCKNLAAPLANPDFGFQCDCSTVQYNGTWCENSQPNPCLINPCQNGGTCSHLGSLGYFCVCPTGCTGYNCQNCTATTASSKK